MIEARRFFPLFCIVLLLIIPIIETKSQEVYFFTEGTDNNFYDQGIVDVNNLGQSSFEYTHPPGGPQWNDKMPCSTRAFKGATSLKFNYTSSPDGNWMVSIFRNNWSSVDLSNLDSLSLFIYSDNEIPNTALPLIGLKTIKKSGSGETSSQLYKLADYNNNIPALTWTRITFPLEHFFNDTNNELDISNSKAIVFNQSENNNSPRTLLIDEISAFKSIGTVPPATSLSVLGYDSHAELNWEFPLPNLSYRIYASFNNGQSFELRGETTENFYLDFIPENARNSTIQYKVVTVAQNKESEPSESTAEIRDFSDDELMNMVQQYSFRYFWEGAHQASGMALERTNDNHTTVASGATGMGLMAMIVAHEREYQPKEDVKSRILMILDFLKTCDRFHGAWSHWYNADTKKVKPFSPKDDGGDLVETSFVAQALIALKNYFSGNDSKSIQIRATANQLWNEIEWDWYRQYGQSVLFWHWSPNTGFEKNMKVGGWNEALITYIMAASSTTYGIPKYVYTEGWAKNGNIVHKRTFYNYEINLANNWGGPLFWLHYTHLGINPHELKDPYADYWQEFVNTAKIHHAYAIDNPLNHKNYSDKCWGLTASDDPYGYTAHKPIDNDNGTISPTAALASMPYTPSESMKALKYFYRERGKELFGMYGPYDAFNDNLNWVKKAYIGIDQGPIVVMIENHRTGLLWDNVMKDANVKAGLDKLEFEYGIINAVADFNQNRQFKIYPNPSSGKIQFNPGNIDFSQALDLKIYTVDGRLLLEKSLNPTNSEYSFNCSEMQNGLYLIHLKNGNKQLVSKLIIQK